MLKKDNLSSYQRPVVSKALSLLKQKNPLLQIMVGPRQVGKTIAALQIQSQWQGESHYVSADENLPPDSAWLWHHWERVRKLNSPDALLIIDEVQKVQNWSEVVKKLYDEDRRLGKSFSVLLLGSSALMLQKGLSESLSGRFIKHFFSHWSYPEVAKAFDASLDDWLYFGGYPGGYNFRSDTLLWKQYIRDSLIETVISKDILQLQQVSKPALLRHLFYLTCKYPAHILSYNKMLGQLQDAGNTTTLANYLQLLGSAFLISGLENYKINQNPKRGSSPKLVLWNNALINAQHNLSLEDIQKNRDFYGFLVENAVGATILNRMSGAGEELYYWRNCDREIDFLYQSHGGSFAIEVKSGRMKAPHGLQKFLDLEKQSKPLIIGGSGQSLESFFNEGV